VAGTDSGRTCRAPSQEHIWHQTSGVKMAQPYFGLDDQQWLPYIAVNSEKTIFKKTKGSDYIIHGLFVDDMMHISPCDELKRNLWINILKILKSQLEAS
jgi:hypothetical protein